MAKRLEQLGPNCAPNIQMALVHRLKNIGPVRHNRGHFNQNICGFRESTFHRKSGYDLNFFLQFLANNSLIDITNIAMLQLSRAKPSNPEL